MIHYGERIFRAVSTVGGGDVSTDTLFRYDQREHILTGFYSGGDVEYGAILGSVHTDGSLSFLYHHMTKSGDLRSGQCQSRPEIIPSGKIRLHERWKWTSGQDAGGLGTSIIEEV